MSQWFSGEAQVTGFVTCLHLQLQGTVGCVVFTLYLALELKNTCIHIGLKRKWLNILTLYPLIFSQVQPKSPKRGTAMCTSVDVSNFMKTSVTRDTTFTLFPFTIPETPESEKRQHRPLQPFSEGPCSPVSRSPRSRGLTCKTKLLYRRSLQAENKTSPKSGDTFEAENGIGHFGSVKRLMRGSETHQKAKRPRTGQLPKNSGKESSSERDDLSKFLQIIHETADMKDEASMKGISKNIERKSGKAVKILTEKNSSISTLSGKTLGNMPSEKRNGASGSFTKLPRVTSLRNSSSEDEKENISLSTEPSRDLAEISSDIQSDLVVSYTSLVCNSDGGEKKENVFICENEMKSKQVKNLDDSEKAITTAEENFSILDDSWFNEEMERNFEEPEHKKFEFEYVFAYFCLHL